jgi:hypothetical protein
MDNALQRGVVVPNEIQTYDIGVHWMLLQLKLQQKMSFSTRWNNLVMGLAKLHQILAMPNNAQGQIKHGSWHSLLCMNSMIQDAFTH